MKGCLLFVSIPSLMGRLLGRSRKEMYNHTVILVSIPSLMGRLLGRHGNKVLIHISYESQYPR